MEKIRILLVDNHRMVLAGLKQMLDRVPDFEVSGEALGWAAGSSPHEPSPLGRRYDGRRHEGS